MYFDQQLGGAHSKSWTLFSHVWHKIAEKSSTNEVYLPLHLSLWLRLRWLADKKKRKKRMPINLKFIWEKQMRLWRKLTTLEHFVRKKGIEIKWKLEKSKICFSSSQTWNRLWEREYCQKSQYTICSHFKHNEEVTSIH